ncbi:hypothetical protein [Azospirillum doebereinerae]
MEWRFKDSGIISSFSDATYLSEVQDFQIADKIKKPPTALR